MEPFDGIGWKKWKAMWFFEVVLWKAVLWMYLVGKWRKWRIWLPSISLVTHVSLTMGTLEREFHLDDASLGWNISDIFWHIIDRIAALLFHFIIRLLLNMSNLNNIMKIDSWVGTDVLGPFSKGLVHRDRPMPRRTFVTRSSSLLS